MRPATFIIGLRLVAIGFLAPALQGCVVASVTGAAVGVAATTVGATAKVAGAAVGVGADAVGAAGKAVTGGGRP
jgi:hypothetical protein